MNRVHTLVASHEVHKLMEATPSAGLKSRRRVRSRRSELLRLGLDWVTSPGDLVGCDQPAHWFSVLVDRYYKDQPENLETWLKEVHDSDDRAYGMWPTQHGWCVRTDLGERLAIEPVAATVSTEEAT